MLLLSLGARHFFRRPCDASGFAEGLPLKADPAAEAPGATAMDHISVVEINGNRLEPNEKTPALAAEPQEIDITEKARVVGHGPDGDEEPESHV